LRLPVTRGMSHLTRFRSVKGIPARFIVCRYTHTTSSKIAVSSLPASLYDANTTRISRTNMPSVLWDLVEPGLRKVKVYTPPDPTYGRYLIEPWTPEKALDEDASIVTRRRRVFLHPDSAPDSVDIEFAEDVELVQEELSKERRRGGRWVYYKTWEMKEESLKNRDGMGVDILIVHGEYNHA
jgi:hypothetical protein